MVMDIESIVRRKKMQKLSVDLLSVEEDRIAGHSGITPEELEGYLESIIVGVENGNVDSVIE